MKHVTEPGFHTRAVRVELVGCGGTGSFVLSGLARLHIAMLELGHPHGLQVTAWDPDRVSHANVGRQLFTMPEVDRFKAECLIHRINMQYGLFWQAMNEKFFPNEYIPNHSIIICCVDSRASRAEINQFLPKRKGPYLLDAGNDLSIAQCILGNGSDELPYPYKVFPSLIDTKTKELNRPSCSLAESLGQQSLFINQWIATGVLEILWQMFRKGGLDHRGFFINLDNGRMNPILINNKPNQGELKNANQTQ